jgi:hypothetical protein
VLRIPASSSGPATETDFDKDQLWRYEVVRRVGSKVFIAERCAEDDYLSSNSVANQLADNLASGVAGPPVSDRTKSPDPKKLYGPVMVAYYDRLSASAHSWSWCLTAQTRRRTAPTSGYAT